MSEHIPVTQQRAAEFTSDGVILAMWKFGLDTNEMAKRLHVHESVIANRLARLRDAGAS